MLMKKHVNSRAQKWEADSRVTQTYETSSKCIKRCEITKSAISVLGRTIFVVSSLWLSTLPLQWLLTQFQLSWMWPCCFIRVGYDPPSAFPCLEDPGPPGSSPAESAGTSLQPGKLRTRHTGTGPWTQPLVQDPKSPTMGQKGSWANTWGAC